MIKYIALRDWTATGIPVEPPFGYLDDIGMFPLNDNEVLLSAHYFPIVIRLDGPRPSIGALMRRDMMVRDLVNSKGQWAGAYSPILLRCFPFRIGSDSPTGDPVADLEFGRVPLKTDKPRLIRMRDDAGAASKDLTVLYEGVKSVWDGQQRLLPALDQLVAAELLVPIGGQSATPPNGEIYYTIDRRRFALWSNVALEAMTRRSFSAIDIATAMSFSQVHVRPELRPSMTAPAATETNGTATAAADSGLISGFESLTPWLDTSELFPGAWAADPSIWSAAPDAARPVSVPAARPPSG